MIRFKILLIKGEPLGGKGSLGLNLLIFFLNPFWLPRSAIKPPPCHFTLCLMPDDFTCQGRASGWERVRTRNTKYFTLYIYMYLTWGSLTLAPKTSLYNLVAFSIYNWSNFTKYIYIYIYTIISIRNSSYFTQFISKPISFSFLTKVVHSNGNMIQLS